MSRNKIVTPTGIVHYGELREYDPKAKEYQGTGAILCHGAYPGKVRLSRTAYTKPITCKRCFARAVYDGPTAIHALGMTIESYLVYMKPRLQDVKNVPGMQGYV